VAPARRATLFPYTTLFRSHVIAGVLIMNADHADGDVGPGGVAAVISLLGVASGVVAGSVVTGGVSSRVVPSAGGQGEGHGQRQRSEEHTSELQSRFDLVCR